MRENREDELFDEAGDSVRVVLALVLELTERCESLADLREVIENVLEM